MNQIVLGILNWYQKNARNLPWRDTKDPYKIWLSEIILQQTQIVQGLNYYEKFIEKFSTINLLAQAEEDQILKLWQGLGYYSRARNLHKAAKMVQEKFNGQFPQTYEEIIQLPGVGDYTASAIASFAYQLPYPVLDGNVFRFIARLYNIDLPIDEQKNRKVFIALLEELMQNQAPDTFNNAMMEMGATVCKPQNPLCDSCPVQLFCEAYKQKTIAMRPVKSKKVKVSTKHFNFFYISYKDGFYLEQRKEKGIWQNLFQLPLIETEFKADKAVLMDKLTLLYNHDSKSKLNLQQEVKHLLTHQTIEAQFWELNLSHQPIFSNKNMVYTNLSEYKNFAVPKLIENYLLLL